MKIKKHRTYLCRINGFVAFGQSKFPFNKRLVSPPPNHLLKVTASDLRLVKDSSFRFGAPNTAPTYSNSSIYTYLSNYGYDPTPITMLEFTDGLLYLELISLYNESVFYQNQYDTKIENNTSSSPNTTTQLTFDANHMVAEEIQTYHSTTPILKTKVLYTYNADRRVVGIISQTWESNAWVNKDKQEFQYNPQGKLIQIDELIWNQQSTWESKDRYLLTYHNNGKLQTMLFQRRNTANTVWQDKIKFQYTSYTSANKPLKYEAHFADSTGAFVPINIEDYTYNIQGQLTKIEIKNAANYTSPPVLSTKIELTYSTTSSLYPSVEDVYEMLDTTFSKYKYSEYTYNTSDKIIKSKMYLKSGTTWYNDNNMTYIYEQYTPQSIKHAAFKDIKLKIYPNPTSATLHLATDLKEGKYIIYNMMGHVVAQGLWANTGGTDIDVAAFSPSMYSIAIFHNQELVGSHTFNKQ